MIVKICGITTVETAGAAREAGADWLGFVFSDSPRRLEPVEAREIIATLPEETVTVAVFRHPDPDLVREVVTEVAPDWIQTDVGDYASLGDLGGCKMLPVYRPETLPQSPPQGPVIFEGPVSGSGETTDWDMAATLAADSQVVLAGGLNAANVGEAIRRVRPWGVDVSSGVEHSPGAKDPEKIRHFVDAARHAATAMENTV